MAFLVTIYFYGITILLEKLLTTVVTFLGKTKPQLLYPLFCLAVMCIAFFSTWQSPVLVKLVSGMPQVCKITIWDLQYELLEKKISTRCIF